MKNVQNLKKLTRNMTCVRNAHRLSVPIDSRVDARLQKVALLPPLFTTISSPIFKNFEQKLIFFLLRRMTSHNYLTTYPGHPSRAF